MAHLQRRLLPAPRRPLRLRRPRRRLRAACARSTAGSSTATAPTPTSPTATAPTSKARIRTYPVREVGDHFVMAWYHPDGAAPLYELDDRRRVRRRRATPDWTTVHFTRRRRQPRSSPRTPSTARTSATCTTPRSCPRSSPTRPRAAGPHALDPAVPDAPRRGRRAHRRRQPRPGLRRHPLLRHRRHVPRRLRPSPVDANRMRGALQLQDPQASATPRPPRASARPSSRRSASSSRRTGRSGRTRPTSRVRRWPTPIRRS